MASIALKRPEQNRDRSTQAQHYYADIDLADNPVIDLREQDRAFTLVKVPGDHILAYPTQNTNMSGLNSPSAISSKVIRVP